MANYIPSQPLFKRQCRMTLSCRAFGRIRMRPRPGWAAGPSLSWASLCPIRSWWVYVTATDSQGGFWYVVNSSQAALGGRPKESAAGSEEEAKMMVLEILKAAYPDSG